MQKTIGAVQVSIDSKVKQIQLNLEEAEHVKKKLMEVAFIVGHELIELKALVGHGHFMEEMSKWFPGHNPGKLERWMRVSETILRHVPLPPGVEPPEQILTKEDEDLSGPAIEFKRRFKDFIQDRTLKECISGVILEERDPISAERAVNGKLKGGKGNGDRKDYPLFIGELAVKISNHLFYYQSYSQAQKSEVASLLAALISGCDIPLSRTMRGHQVVFTFDFSGSERKRARMPRELCRVLMSALKQREKENIE